MAPSPETVSQASATRRKKESPGFLHDSNARHDQKILALRAEGGFEYYGLYWACIEIMREDADLLLRSKSLKGICLSLSISFDKLSAFIECAIDCGLFVHAPDGYTSPSLRSRMDRYEERREQARSAGRASAESRKTPVPSVAQQTLNDRSTSVQPIHQQTLNVPNTNTNTNPNANSNPNGEVQEGASYAEIAEKALVPAEDPAVCTNSAFINAGWRPMRKYPDLWISLPNLIHVFEDYAQSGIPPDRFKLGFAAAVSYHDRLKREGKDLSRFSAYETLIGRSKQKALEALANERRAEREGMYLDNAKVRK